MKRTLALGAAVALVWHAQPALADCAGTVQEASRVDGVWTGLSGPLVEAQVAGTGLAWTVADGSELDEVRLETVPTEVGDATISAAVVMQGGLTGEMPVVGDGDVVVQFVGTPVCSATSYRPDTITSPVATSDVRSAIVLADSVGRSVLRSIRQEASTVDLIRTASLR